jgi:hypothetical protein
VVATLPQGSGEMTPLLRLSNDEREQAVAVLNEAVADGRLTWEEHAERVDGVYKSRTRAELAPFLADLGTVDLRARRALAPVEGGARVEAFASKIIRKPEPGQSIRARARFGAVYLDFTDFEPGDDVLVEASSFCGKVVLTVPEGATVVDSGDAVFGKRKVLYSETDGDGPVIRISGRSTLGHMKVFGPGRRWW